MDWNKTDDGGVKLEDRWIVEREEITAAQRRGDKARKNRHLRY